MRVFFSSPDSGPPDGGGGCLVGFGSASGGAEADASATPRRLGACRRWALLVEGRTLLAAPYAFTRDLIGTVRGPWGDDLGSRHAD